MYHSFFDVFSIGIGPSSSHTVGPMRAALRYVKNLEQLKVFNQTEKIQVILYGSLALTGVGHGTPNAVVYGLLGLEADTIDLSQNYIQQIQVSGKLLLNQKKEIAFQIEKNIILDKTTFLPEHSNGMKFQAFDNNGNLLKEEIYFSIGGGTIVRSDELNQKNTILKEVPYPFDSCSQLMQICIENKMTIADVVFKNEEYLHSFTDIKKRIEQLISVMNSGIERGIVTEGYLPGDLGIVRRAPIIYRRLEEKFHWNDVDPLMVVDWINLWAFAVAEENACGGQIVTAPTMGSAGVIPAVLRYYERFASKKSPFEVAIGQGIFLLTASAICSLYRTNASISGAEVGCQGEIGVAASMAAAGLTAAMGGTNKQIENAAEIAMEHHLGLTCDPICGLVQVPCIERNAISALKAVNAARLALRGNGNHLVTLDSVIKTMYETGQHLASGYKETSLAGLAKNVFSC
ncbi:MAG: L-serine ammonia-lyase [Alphaproteobacteria bacterium]|nr:L-serine ammonia-lyase [Alphaproteobacteria bacterium]